MQKAVATTASTIKCEKINGTVTANRLNSKLYVGNDAVLVAGDLQMASIAGCTQTTNTNDGTKTCAAVLTPSGGEASKLFVGTQAVLNEDLGGTTDGLDPSGDIGISVITVGQTKLEAA